MSRNILAIVGMLTLTLVVLPARAQQRSLFPDTLPNDIEATVGRRTIVIPDGTDGLHHFPDGPLSILSARPLRFLMPVANKTVLVTGRDFGNLTSQVEVMGPSGSGPDANYAGVYSTWRRGPNDRFVAIYHGENHAGMGLMEGNDINGAVWSVCMGMIDPTTGRIERRGEILRADKPKRPIAGRPHEVAALRIQGVGEPSMTPDRSDDYLLCYYTEASNRLDRRVCICVARSPIGEQGAPGSWKKFYQGRWDEPGLGGHETPILTAEGGDVGQAFVTFVKAWDRYVIVVCHQGFEDFQAGQSKQSGVYVATSRDGEKWTAPQRIMAAMTVPKTGRSFVQHPTLIVTSVTKDQLQGRLFYAFSPRWPMPHRLAASPITIRLKQSQTPDERSPSSVRTEMGWTYLADLPRIGVTQQYGWWSDRGELVLGGSADKPPDRKPLQFGGKTSPHGIYLHARPSDNAAITYRLRKQFSSFRSQVVIPEMFPWQGDPRTPLVFKIEGDGRLLWQSKPMGQKGDNQMCEVSVAGVDELSLLIDCPGPENWGLAAWIEPQVSTAPTPSNRTSSLGSKLDAARWVIGRGGWVRLVVNGKAVMGKSAEDIDKLHDDDITIQIVSLGGLDTTVDDINHLVKLMPDLDHLFLDRTKVSDKEMTAVTRFTHLRELGIFETGITGRGIETVGRMKTLEFLEIGGGANISIDDLKPLTGLPNLKSLELHKMGDEIIPLITKLNALKSLQLRACQISPKGLAALREAVPSLKILDLGPTTGQ